MGWKTTEGAPVRPTLTGLRRFLLGGLFLLAQSLLPVFSKTLVSPGEVFTLVFRDAQGALSWQVEPFRPLLLPQKGEGLVLLPLEAPLTLPPGVYPVCLLDQGALPNGNNEKGTPLCQEVEVRRVERLQVQVPARAEGVLALLLANRGNVALRISLGSAPESQVALTPLTVEVGPGEARRLELPLGEGGELILLLAYGERRERYLVRVEGPGGSPAPYRLGGRLALGYPGPYGLVSLEGPLAREAGLALRLEGEGVHLGGQLGLNLGAWGVSFSTRPSFELSYREGPWRLALAYPWAVAAQWGDGKSLFHLEATPERFRLGYASLGLSLQGGCGLLASPLACQAPFFRLDWLGELGYYLAWEGGALRLGASGPGFNVEGSPYPLPWAKGVLFGALAEGAYRLEGAWDPGGVGVAGSLSWPLPLDGVATRLRLGASLGREAGVSLGVSQRTGPLSLHVEGRIGLGQASSQGGLTGVVDWDGGPYGLRWEGFWTAGEARFYVEGRYAFSLAVPYELTSALGGYDQLPLEGRVLLEGKPLASARVVAKEAFALSDHEGRFRIFLPREGGVRMRILPPPEALALPLEVAVGPPPWPPMSMELPPASHLRLACEGQGGKGAYAVGPVTAFLACGGQAVVPPGVYRLWPEAQPGYEASPAGSPQEVQLAPLGEVVLDLSFQPRATKVLEANEADVAVRVFPPRPAPGEEVRLEVEGVRGEVWLSFPGRESDRLAGTIQDGVRVFAFQVPWDAGKGLSLRLLGEGFSREIFLPVDPGRELLVGSLNPPRASLGQEVEVRAEVRFPAEEVSLRFPGGQSLALVPLGKGVYGARFLLDEAMASLAESVGRVLGLRLALVAKQGEREIQRQLRLLLR